MSISLQISVNWNHFLVFWHFWFSVCTSNLRVCWACVVLVCRFLVHKTLASALSIQSDSRPTVDNPIGLWTERILRDIMSEPKLKKSSALESPVCDFFVCFKIRDLLSFSSKTLRHVREGCSSGHSFSLVWAFHLGAWSPVKHFEPCRQPSHMSQLRKVLCMQDIQLRNNRWLFSALLQCHATLPEANHKHSKI